MCRLLQLRVRELVGPLEALMVAARVLEGLCCLALGGEARRTGRVQCRTCDERHQRKAVGLQQPAHSHEVSSLRLRLEIGGQRCAGDVCGARDAQKHVTGLDLLPPRRHSSGSNVDHLAMRVDDNSCAVDVPLSRRSQHETHVHHARFVLAPWGRAASGGLDHTAAGLAEGRLARVQGGHHVSQSRVSNLRECASLAVGNRGWGRRGAF